jgi:pimeloyl-ACP methyl ester carboxylesterase
VETRFVQVAPVQPPEGQVLRSPGHTRAVVLIEGLHLHLVNHQRAALPELRPWQQPGSVLVRTLVKDADVFAFTYGQTAPVTAIADLPALPENIMRLRQAGYTEIVLVGFSAGGLVARQFVEDNPTCGVTRVIQVCTPNLGSGLARLKAGVGALQQPFVQSLSKESCIRALEQRQGKKIPDGVEFVCVVGNGLVTGDGVVSTRSQWPEDLQAQGVPAVTLGTEHWEALRSERAAQVIAALARVGQPRWNPAQVDAMRKQLFRGKAETR